jgi:2-oxoglutarate ferredoxin oxidoreductase subunit alpha
MSRIKIEKHLLSDSEVKGKEYKRYILTSNGISPRALPGQNGALVIADSDEHDEEGHIDESIDNRVKMIDKRLKKLELLRKEISAPEVYGGEDVGLTLIGWGSTFGPLSETVDMLNTKESKANLIHFSEVYPLPLKTVRSILENTAKTICVENNATGQFARILKVETDFKVSDEILKYDGRPFTPEAIIRELKKRGAV